MYSFKVIFLAAAVALAPFTETGAKTLASPSRSGISSSVSTRSKAATSFGSFGGSKASAAPSQAISVPTAVPAAPSQARPAFGSFGGRAAAVGAAGGAAYAIQSDAKPAALTPGSNSALNRSLDQQMAKTNSINALDQREAGKVVAPAPQVRTQETAINNDVNGRATATLPPLAQQQPQVPVRVGGGISPLNAGILGYLVGSAGHAHSNSMNSNAYTRGVSPVDPGQGASGLLSTLLLLVIVLGAASLLFFLVMRKKKRADVTLSRTRYSL